jgi:hypothetical protein
MNTIKNSSNKTVIMIALTLFLLLLTIIVVVVVKNSQKGGVLRKVPQEEIDKVSVNSTTWRTIPFADYGYDFTAPKDWLVIQNSSTRAEDVSGILGVNKQKQMTALSKEDWYHVYVLPEGGYSFADPQIEKDAESIKTANFKGKEVMIETYDQENITIRFKNYHDFRIQIFVSNNHPEGWVLVERILEKMNIEDKEVKMPNKNIPSTTSTSSTPAR